ncbi:MAG: hypothetical protein KJ799_08175 [Bacteroidetes bacterium]|nr:hypothetical protein [Bacteroidota bacterium]
MKKNVLFVSLLLSLSFMHAQQINKLSLSDFYYPSFSPDGNKILVTSENYKGLWLYDLELSSLQQISDDFGAGYEPVFSNDGNSIIYRTNDYKERIKYSSLKEYNLQNKTHKSIVDNVRELSLPLVISNSAVAFVQENQIKEFSYSLMKTAEPIPVVFIEKSKIALIENGGKTIFEPWGEGNYIWPSISPDGKLLLFTLAGKGTFISDLDGNVFYELGKANAPCWSGNGEYVVYMIDEDDGQAVTASDIYMFKLSDFKVTKLTNTDEIYEMYPKCSSSGNIIVFNTDAGEIYLLNLDIE